MTRPRNRAFAGALALLVTLASFALLCPACSVTVGQQNPHPNVALSPQERNLRLSLASDVPQHVEWGDFHIERWHETLAAGFRNAFGPDDGAPAKSDDDRTLTLEQTRVELDVGRYAVARARIQYKATLTKGGVVVQRFAGTAMKKGAITDPAPTAWSDVVAADLTGAVEDMYEQIAKELSQGPPAPTAAEPPRCVPGRSVACAGPKGCQGFQLCGSDGTFGDCRCDG